MSRRLKHFPAASLPKEARFGVHGRNVCCLSSKIRFRVCFSLFINAGMLSAGGNRELKAADFGLIRMGRCR